MPTAKEIRITAIEQIKSQLPLESDLRHLEFNILHSNPSEFLPQAEALIKAIAKGEAPTIALVFNSRHDNCIALPLPGCEIAALDQNPLPANLPAISRDIFDALLDQYTAPPYSLQQDVILIGRNEDEKYPVFVAYMDIDPQNDKYKDWIERVRDALNGVNSSW